MCYHLENLNIESEILSVKFNKKESNELVNKYHLTWLSFPYDFLKSLRISSKLNNYLYQTLHSKNNIIINIHNQWNYIAYLALQLKKKYNLTLVATIRGSIKLDKFQKKIAWILFQKKMLNKCDFVHVTKESDILDLRKMGINSKIAYVPNGINLDEFENKLSSELAKKDLKLAKNKKYILFLGRIHQSKGLEYLVNSWIKLSYRYQNWDL